jgi:amino-acid N-acetyltransferase
VIAVGDARPQTGVRRATGADYRGVMHLLEAANLPVAGVPSTLTDFYVAEDQGRILGAVGLELYGADALLRSAVVDAAARGAGTGRALVQRILGHARERGVRAVYLLTTTAERYFLRFGFDRIAREEVPAGVKASIEFRGACPASAVVMRRVMIPTPDAVSVAEESDESVPSVFPGDA